MVEYKGLAHRNWHRTHSHYLLLNYHLMIIKKKIVISSRSHMGSFNPRANKRWLGK